MAVYLSGGPSAERPVTPEVEALVAAVRPATEAAKKTSFDAFIPVSYRSQVTRKLEHFLRATVKLCRCRWLQAPTTL